MKPYGDIGHPVLLYEAYEDWRREQLEEADSVADFPQFLFGPIRSSMWHAYERHEPQYQRYTRKENLPDFRERRLKGLLGFSKPGYVGDHGHYPGMSRGERPSASLVVDTYGGVYGITRHAVINDETSDLLSTIPDGMGDASAEFIVETIIALIESNPTAPDGAAFFSGSRGNEVTTALSENALAAGISFLARQRDDSNRRIRVTAKTLAVGDATLKWIADRILNSTETGTNIQYTGAAGVGSAIFDKGKNNPIAGLLPADATVFDPYWSDVNNWYLFADPARVPAFAAGFLNGNEKPQVFLKNPEVRSVLGGGGQDPYTFEFDSIDYKVRMDFGVAAVDPRGAYRAVVA